MLGFAAPACGCLLEHPSPPVSTSPTPPTPSEIAPSSPAATLTKTESCSLASRPIICHFTLQSQQGASCCQGFPCFEMKDETDPCRILL